MKTIKYILLSAIIIGFTACNDDEPVTNPLPELTSGTANFSKYVAVGASFSAGFTDNALFKVPQENSFPNIMAKEFAKLGGGDFVQPLMNDNVGGFLVSGAQSPAYLPRLYLNGSAPAVLNVMSTTNILSVLNNGPFNNVGIPGAKSFHLTLPGTTYGALNPYYGRMNPGANSMVQYAVQQLPTFFSLSEIGGNDVLSYATGGGVGVDRTGDPNVLGYGPSDITDPTVFASVFTNVVNALTAQGAKGVVGTVPYITRLPHFTTIVFNQLDPLSPTIGPLLIPQIPILNAQLYGPLDAVFTAGGEPNRVNVLSATTKNPLLINDENAIDRSAQIADAYGGGAMGAAFGAVFGKARQATSNDLIVLSASNAIAGVVAGAPAGINIRGISFPMEDNWVLIPSEQLAIKNAVDAYNATINSVANTKGLAVVDFNVILETAATTGISSPPFTLTTRLVVGGLVSLDGVHLTSRGYAVMANEFLKAIDAKYGSNFIASGNMAKAGDYPTNYPLTFRRF